MESQSEIELGQVEVKEKQEEHRDPKGLGRGGAGGDLGIGQVEQLRASS